jgi:hypothetical protein
MPEINENVAIDAFDNVSESDLEALWSDETASLDWPDEADQQSLDDEGATDDADVSEVEGTEETDGAEQPEQSDESEEPESKEEPQTPPEPEKFKLKYMGEEIEVSRDEVIQLAQKGKDYDRIRSKYDEFTAFASKHPAYEEQIEFLNDLAKQSNMTVDKLIEETRIRQLVDQGLDETIAREKYALEKEKRQLEREKAGIEKLKQTAETSKADQERRAKDIQEFLAEYPDVKPDELKGLREVWDMVANGKSLVDAYRAYEVKSLKQQMKDLQAKLEAAEKNKANKAKSTGSAASSGKKDIDPFLSDWYSDD